MSIESVCAIVIPIFTLLGGYFIARKQNIEESKRRFKEEHYCELLNLLQAFVGSTATTETKRKFFSEYYKSWVYADETVITAIKTLIDSQRVDLDVQKKQQSGVILLGNIVLAIRNDLGVKTTLKQDSFRYIDVIDEQEES